MSERKYFGEEKIDEIVMRVFEAGDPACALEDELSRYIPGYVLEDLNVAAVYARSYDLVNNNPAYRGPRGGTSEAQSRHKALHMTASRAFKRFDSLQEAYEKFGQLPMGFT